MSVVVLFWVLGGYDEYGYFEEFCIDLIGLM